MMRKTFLIGLILLACGPVSARGYGYMTCGGVKVVWDDSFSMVQNTFSIPPGGLREASLDNAINRWRGVQGMLDMVSKSPLPNPGSTYTVDDGQNDAVIVARSDIAATTASPR